MESTKTEMVKALDQPAGQPARLAKRGFLKVMAVACLGVGALSVPWEPSPHAVGSQLVETATFAMG